MSKTRRGLLIAGTVMNILSCVIALIIAVLLIWFGSKFTGPVLVEIFRSVPEQYQYHTNYLYQGVVYDYVIIDTMANEIMLPETLEMAANLFKTVFSAIGFVVAAFNVVKLLLAIVSLAASRKKLAKGAVIALIVFSFLTFSIIEAGLLIGALCAKSKKVENSEQNNEQMPQMYA